MIRRRSQPPDRPALAIAPMIDCVFLLLIYFMVSATLQRQEADLSFQLPGTIELAEPLPLPNEQLIEITAEGQVLVNDHPCDAPEATQFTELAAMLARFRQASEAQGNTAQVTIAPSALTPHQSIVRVMDAVSRAGITAIPFADFEEPISAL